MAAILDAALRLFAEKPYDAVTMTEIAARSKTAIAQVYRFFPTKEILTDALLARYRERIDIELGLLASRSNVLSAAELCDALLAFMTGLGEHRSAALLLLDTRHNTTEQRTAIRNLMLLRFREILAASTRGASPERSDGSAELLLQMLKLAAAEPTVERESTERFRAELKAALTAYLADLIDGAPLTRPGNGKKSRKIDRRP